MHIPQDVVDPIIDQLSLLAGYKWRHHLRDASLVSTTWVNRSQHHLFSTLEFDKSWQIKRWCSQIKPDPYGVSRHVRVLIIGCGGHSIHSPLKASDVKTALPHLISFKNLRELTLGLVCASLGVLTPVLSSSPGILKLHRWTYENVGIHETLQDISAVVDLLPNLTHVSLSGYWGPHSEIRIQLPADEGSSLAIKRFKFHRLGIVVGIPRSPSFFETCGPHLQVLDLHESGMRTINEHDHRVFRTLLEACHTLQVLNVCFIPRIAQFLGSIPSSSVSLIRISNPFRIGSAPMTYSESWLREEFEVSRTYNNYPAEFTHLGASIRKIAQRYSDNHSGLKTRVQTTLYLAGLEIQAVENGDVPFYKMRLEEELGGHVDFELTLRRLEDKDKDEFDTET